MSDSERSEPLTFDILIMKQIDRMILSKAALEKWKYWTFFSSTARLMASYIPIDARIQMEKDFTEMMTKIKTIKISTELNDATKKMKQEELRWDYADNYEYILNKALSRTGLIKNKDEGEIDIEKIDIELLGALIRRGAYKGKAVEGKNGIKKQMLMAPKQSDNILGEVTVIEKEENSIENPDAELDSIVKNAEVEKAEIENAKMETQKV